MEYQARQTDLVMHVEVSFRRLLIDERIGKTRSFLRQDDTVWWRLQVDTLTWTIYRVQ